jgi:2-hydroxychromene-2-carboxylate isomerase
MDKIVDYYFSPSSPWTYLGHERFRVIARRHGAAINPKPIDLGQVFPVSGGLPLAKRAPQRQAYRLVELRRWRDYLGMTLNFQPRFVAASAETPSRWIIAALQDSTEAAMDLAGALLRARWAEERDTADEATLVDIANGLGQDAVALQARAAAPGAAELYAAFTREAIERQVFGAPTYVYRDEPFWGQDRLDFLDRALAQ